MLNRKRKNVKDKSGRVAQSDCKAGPLELNPELRKAISSHTVTGEEGLRTGVK